MREILVSQIKEGVVFPAMVLHQSGMQLLYPKEKVTKPILQSIRNVGVNKVYVLEDGERLEDARRQLVLMPIPVKELKEGEILARSIYDTSGTLLLEGNSTIPKKFATSLARRGIEVIYYRKPEEQIKAKQGRQLREKIESLLNAVSDGFTSKVTELAKIDLGVVKPEEITESRVSEAIESANSLEVVPEGKALEEELNLEHRLVMQSEEEKEIFVDIYEESICNVRDLYMRLSKNSKVDGSLVRRVAQNTVAGLIRNRELMMAAGNISLPGNYLVAHSVGVAIYAINIGVTMGYSKKQILSLGYGALLHDVGMLQVPGGILDKPAKPSRNEWQEIYRHPAHGLDMLQRIVGIPAEVPFIVYQSHERNNGTGYPKGKRDVVIHSYAKIVAVADIYNSICSDRPYRKAKTPYEAMETLVLMCGKRQLDPKVVKCFLKCNSMFPIGSWVELSNKCKARVVASNSEDYMRPCVTVVFNDKGERLNKLVKVDLLEHQAVSVRKALTNVEVGKIELMDGF